MAKELTFTFEGNNYTLAFTRNTVKIMEANGFNAEELRAKPNLSIERLFAGAFLAHHKHTKQEVIDKIFKQLPQKDVLLTKLFEMYNEPMEALFAEPDEGNAVSWTATF